MTPVATTGPRTAARHCARESGGGADLILAAGGDGTINEVLNGMVHSEVPLGILPAGTANVLACEMRLGTRMISAAEGLSSCEPQRIALGASDPGGRGGGRHFVLMAGAGLDALIVYQIKPA